MWYRLYVELVAGGVGDRVTAALMQTMLANAAERDDPDPLAVWYRPLGFAPGEDFAALGEVLRGRLWDLPPAVVPDERALAGEAGRAVLVDRLATLVAYVGPGRRLTRAGNLTPADGLTVAALVGPWRLARPGMLEPVGRVRSARELPGVDLLVQTAVGAGFCQRRAGRLTVAERGARLGVDPPDDVADAVDALLAAGPLTLCDARTRMPSWCGWLDDAVPLLLEWLYRAGGTLPAHRMVAWLVCLGLRGFPDDHPWRADPSQALAFLAADLQRIVDVLAVAGVASWVVPADPDRQPVGVALTGLGRWYTRRRLLAAGRTAPLAGTLAGLPAADLLATVSGWTPEAASSGAPPPSTEPPTPPSRSRRYAGSRRMRNR